MSELLNNNPLFILFLVIALGYGVGSLSFKGNKLGVAAVLFCGLILGNIFTEAHIPETLIWMGLIIFIYSIGLNGGANFFNIIRRNGKKLISFILFNLLLLATLTIIAALIFDIERATLAGMFAGATTNTSSLAALLDLISQSRIIDKTAVTNQAVTGFSISYPMGIFGVIIAMILVEKILSVNYKKEEETLREEYDLEAIMHHALIKVTRPEQIGKTLRKFKKEHNLKVVFGRYSRESEVQLSNFDTIFKEGDRFYALGNESEMERCIELLGSETSDKFPEENSDFVKRRVFVSNPKVVGQTLASLNLNENYSVIVSRIRRGDIDLLATNDTILELGDRLRFMAKEEEVKEIQELFGDSYDKVSKINLATFGIGIFIGLWVGTIQFPLSGDVYVKLGFAGGPLLVALILGAIHKTGSVLWTIPYSTNMTLRQIGLIIMLAGIGINSGTAFFDTIASKEGLMIFCIGVAVVVLSALISLIVGYKMFKIPYSLLLGLLANQPAILDFGEDRTQNKLPNIGFSLMLPIAIIIKIFITQIIFILYTA